MAHRESVPEAPRGSCRRTLRCRRCRSFEKEALHGSNSGRDRAAVVAVSGEGAANLVAIARRPCGAAARGTTTGARRVYFPRAHGCPGRTRRRRNSPPPRPAGHAVCHILCKSTKSRSRSHAPRGNASPPLCGECDPQRSPTCRRAASCVFPRGAWEPGLLPGLFYSTHNGGKNRKVTSTKIGTRIRHVGHVAKECVGTCSLKVVANGEPAEAGKKRGRLHAPSNFGFVGLAPSRAR